MALAVGLSFGGALSALPALAQSCGEDLQKLSQKRMAEMQAINGMVEAAKKAEQLDPAAFCAKSAGLNAAENAMIAYMEKKKEWCQIPDEVISQLKGNHAKSVAFSAKACKVAAEIKKKQEQGDGGAAGAGAAGRPAVSSWRFAA